MASSPRYLVTGGAGFIGSNIVAALTKAGERVRVLDNLATGRWALVDRVAKVDLVEKITGDIRDPETVANAVKGVEIVFHEAALGSVPRSIEKPIDTDRVNVGGTVVVLDEARRAGVRRVIDGATMGSSYSSSTSTFPRKNSTIARCHVITQCGAIHGVSIKVRVDMALPLSILRSHGVFLFSFQLRTREREVPTVRFERTLRCRGSWWTRTTFSWASTRRYHSTSSRPVELQRKESNLHGPS